MLRDFTPEAVIYQGTMWPILPVRCTCSKRFPQRNIERALGVELERLLEENPDMPRVDRFAAARIKVFADLGYTRECCLLALTHYPFYTMNDIEGEDAYLDTTASNGTGKIPENVYLSYHSDEVPREFYPKTRGKLGFNMNAYCQKLHIKTLETTNRKISSSINATTLTGESSFPKFPFLAGVDVRKYPSITTTIPHPTFDYEEDEY